MKRLNDSDFSLDGFTDLQQGLKKAIRIYPDLAETRLRAIARNFKKDVISETEKKVNKHTGNLVKGFKLDRMQGYRENVSIDFRGTAPHFHLIENGHNQTTKDGKVIGWVEGKHIVKKMREGYADNVMPLEMNRLYEDIIKECDLN